MSAATVQAVVQAHFSPTDCPRTAAAQNESWNRYGNDNNYMRMIEAYTFACSLERELAEREKRLEALMRLCREERHLPTYEDLLLVKGASNG